MLLWPNFDSFVEVFKHCTKLYRFHILSVCSGCTPLNRESTVRCPDFDFISFRH